MKHTYQVITEKTVDITVRQFVTKYLRQIEIWQDEYDFLWRIQHLYMVGC
ncbi:hypothetical protein [Enterococcus sp.]|nr:hypothetical protein [Enterococcus sp.]MBP8751207.1 hypothetical protein [Enterococcus sp.]